MIKDLLDLAWHPATRMKFGTFEQKWDLFQGFGPNWDQVPNLWRALFLLFGFFLFRNHIFQNRTKTFSRDQIYPKPRLFFRNQIFLKPKPKLFFETKFSEIETETLKILAKFSKPRSFETEMSISDTWQSLSASQCISLAKCLTRQEQQEVVAALRTRNRQYFDQAQATTILDQDTDKANIALQEVFTHMFTIALIFGHNDSKRASIQQFFGWWKKHRKNCECCPVSRSLSVS